VSLKQNPFFYGIEPGKADDTFADDDLFICRAEHGICSLVFGWAHTPKLINDKETACPL
jgi:hypothetical protein